MSRTTPHVSLPVEVSLRAKTAGLGSKVSLFAQDGDVRAATVRNELIGDVRNVLTGFLKNNRMELPTGRRNNISGGACGPVLDSTEEQRDGIDDA